MQSRIKIQLRTRETRGPGAWKSLTQDSPRHAERRARRSIRLVSKKKSRRGKAANVGRARSCLVSWATSRNLDFLVSVTETFRGTENKRGTIFFLTQNSGCVMTNEMWKLAKHYCKWPGRWQQPGLCRWPWRQKEIDVLVGSPNTQRGRRRPALLIPAACGWDAIAEMGKTGGGGGEVIRSSASDTLTLRCLVRDVL